MLLKNLCIFVVHRLFKKKHTYVGVRPLIFMSAVMYRKLILR